MLRTIFRLGIALMVVGFVLAVLEFALTWVFCCLGVGFACVLLGSLAQVEQQNNDYLLAIAEHSREADQAEIPNVTATRTLLIAIVAISLFTICAGFSIYLNNPLPALFGFLLAVILGLLYAKKVYESRCSTWRAFAEEQQLHFDKGKLFDWRGGGPVVSGSFHNRELSLRTVWQSNTRTNQQYAMLRLAIDLPIEFHFCVDDGQWSAMASTFRQVLEADPRLFSRLKALSPHRFSLFERELSLTLPRIPQTQAELDFIFSLANQLAVHLEDHKTDIEDGEPSV